MSRACGRPVRSHAGTWGSAAGTGALSTPWASEPSLGWHRGPWLVQCPCFPAPSLAGVRALMGKGFPLAVCPALSICSAHCVALGLPWLLT